MERWSRRESRGLGPATTAPDPAILGAWARGRRGTLVCRLPWRPTMTEDTDRPLAATRSRRSKKSPDPAPTVTTTDQEASATTAAAAASPPVPTATSVAPLPAGLGTTAPTKSATVIKLLLRARGATAMELIAATDWQPHSVRAFLSACARRAGCWCARSAEAAGSPITWKPSQRCRRSHRHGLLARAR